MVTSPVVQLFATIAMLLALANAICADERKLFVGVNYLSLYHTYRTPDAVLRRDFMRFKRDGLSVISLSLYWYRIEGDEPGDFSGANTTNGRRGFYGDAFLERVKRVIEIAHRCGLRVIVSFHTLWGKRDSAWCTPDYVKDPSLATTSAWQSCARSN